MPSMRHNNQMPLADAQRFDNRFNRVLPTERGLVPEEILKNPALLFNQQQSAEKLPIPYDPRYSS